MSRAGHPPRPESGRAASRPARLLARFDRYQQRSRSIGFAVAVGKKYSEDQGSYLAATITYYAFFSLFPLLLVFVTVLGYLLHGHPSLEHRVVSSTAAELPVIGTQLKLHALHGSALALGLGLAAALWAGTSVEIAVENAFNQVWGVPFTRRLSFFLARLRGLLMLLSFGTVLIVSTVISAATGFGGSHDVGLKIGGVALSLLANFVLFIVAFRILTAAEVSWRSVWPGAAAGAALWTLLQALGGVYVREVLAKSSNAYGTFALVIGLLSWVYLTAHVVLLCAEANVVATRRLWPRSLSPADDRRPTEADERALRQRADIEDRRRGEQIEVEFDDGGHGPPGAR